ncbi:MAG: hypothetical protein HY815_22985, partial [Candidatus Riflebacteria bacterium]|nr:hypothetical protein [Candidatus Riflebacteria bacterium]
RLYDYDSRWAYISLDAERRLTGDNEVVQVIQMQVDDIYAVVNGMELLRRELEVCRQVTHPKASNTSSGRREFLVTVDAGGQVVVYAVVKGNLVAQTMAVASSSPVPDRIVIPRVDRIVFHHRSDVHAVRLQVFMGGVSLVATVRSINDLAPTSFDFDDTYGI